MISLSIAYLVNQYPKVSHAFIRREVQALEQHGLTVERVSIRSCHDELVDSLDQDEAQKTTYIIDRGLGSILYAVIQALILRPIGSFKTFGKALNLGFKSDRGWLVHLAYFVEACVLIQILQRHRIQHIHVHFGTNSATVALLCHHLSQISYSLTIHGPEEFDKPLSLSLREKINSAKFVVAVSSFGRSQLYRWCDYSHWKKINVVHCGINDTFQAVQNRHSTPPEKTLVCVGRLCEQKGQLILLEALDKLIQNNVNIHLTLVGDGPLRLELETWIKAHGLEPHVTFTGWATEAEVKDYILNATLFVLPSFAEGLPVVLMEALALGVPVISTYVAGIPELVQQGKNGWLVPAGCPQALADSLAQALDTSPQDLANMGQIGAQQVLRDFNSYQEGLKLARLFEKYIQQK